uniref:Uncharacterized protein n=1 Tax=Meloidogyne enterolobii TaxID=390850 RepID=A0A6V7UW52_MELEN|nr:unnamed protein product [Meloidogyne enterolobii]
MMDLDAEKFYERIYELNTELCHSAGKKKRKVQKKIYKDSRELLNKAEKILSDEGDGIFACELIWASFALVMARFFMKWNLNIKSHRALGELAKYTVRFHKKPSARDFLRLFVKDIHNMPY